MRTKGVKATDTTIDFLRKVPIFPEKISPGLLGMKNCNMPTESFLAEDDDGSVFFLSEYDKQRTIEFYVSMCNNN